MNIMILNFVTLLLGAFFTMSVDAQLSNLIGNTDKFVNLFDDLINPFGDFLQGNFAPSSSSKFLSSVRDATKLLSKFTVYLSL